ncbi:MAG TPA: heme exporter protein CcmB [Bacteroidales bacterium]|nr:heme exporter protein CcmB [Bacteroidales bacterium]HPS62511.1 heme exporter protein CcmB [Bacteroidales bacterium]
MLTGLKTLVGKEIRLELKQKYVLNGILLYLVSTVYVTYLAFEETITPETWNSLFWIILLFVAVNGISKSFLQESPARHLYYYTLASPQAIILAKILYNLLLMAILSGLTFVTFLLLMGDRVSNLPLFILTLSLGSLGLSAVLTMVAAIASRAGNNFSLMAILSFPIVLPLLATLMKVSRQALTGTGTPGLAGFLVILATIITGVIALAYLLFPYLWKD